MAINPLNLPDPIRQQSIDWSPLADLGSAYSQYRNRQDIKKAIEGSINPDGSLDIGRAAASLASLGRTNEASNLLNASARQGVLGLAREKFVTERTDEASKRQREQNALRGLFEPTIEEQSVGPQSSARGSWYSQLPDRGWIDRQDRPGSNALGVPDEKQGIALPSRNTLGQWFDVTSPDGKTYRLQQTDVGPAMWTGRGVDISAAAADQMGYRPNTFPTGGRFSWKAAPGPPPATPISPNIPPLTELPPSGSFEVAQQGPLTVAPSAKLAAPGVSREDYITRLEKMVANPDLPQGAKEVAKLRLQRLTQEQKAAETPEMAGVKAGAQERYKESVKAEVEARGEASTATKQISTLSRIETLADRLNTGKLAPTRMNMAALAKDIGISDEVAKTLGLRPDQLADSQAFTGLVNELVVNKIGKGGFPANNFSDADRAFLTTTVPGLGDDPAAVKLKIEVARAVARRALEKQNQWRDFRKQNPNASYFDFEDKWNQDVERMDAFGNAKRDAEDLLAKKSPQGQSMPPMQGARLAPDGNWYVPDSKRPGKYLQVVP